MAKQLMIKYANGTQEIRKLPDDAEVIYKSDGTPMWIAWGKGLQSWQNSNQKMFLGTGMAFWEIQDVKEGG